jgi:hypothetical protein
MALRDPDEPLFAPPDQALEDALAQSRAPWAWIPESWNTDDQSITVIDPTNIVKQVVAIPPKPPPPPPKEQRIGGTAGVIETAAGPAIAGGDDIEMPPENMRPVAIGAPREATVGSVLGEMATSGMEQPAGPTSEPLALYHEGQFEQTGMDRPPPPPSEPRYVGPDLGIKPEKSAEQLGLEYAQDPTRLLAAEFDHAERQKEWFDEQARVARYHDQAQAEQNHRLRLEAEKKTQADMAKLNADVVELGNRKIDTGRWYRDRSTAGKIGAWVSAVVGGLVSGRTGGPNVGLQAILKMIDDDVDAQKADIANQHQALGMRRGIIADEYTRSGDAFRSAEAYRIASYDRVIADLQSQAQQFGPRSARAIAIGKMIHGAAAQRQAAEEAALKRYYDLHKADAELQGKLLDNEAKRRKMGGAGMGGGGGAVPANLTDKDFESLTPPAWFKGTPTQWLETRNKHLQGKKLESEVTSKANPSGMSDQQLEREVILPDGQKFIARGGTEDIGKLRKRVAATETIVRLMDEAIRIRTGWTSDVAKSDEWRQLKANWAAAIGVGKDVLDLGALSGPDMDLVEKFIGTNDPTEFRNPEAGILKARDNLLNLVNDSVKSAGGPKFTIKYIKPEPPKPTDRDLAFKRGQKEPTLTDVMTANAEARRYSAQGGVNTKELIGKYVADGDEPSLDNVVLPDVQKFIDRAGASLKSKDAKEVADARTALENLLSTGGNSGTKQAALRALSVLPEYQNPVARGGQ